MSKALLPIEQKQVLFYDDEVTGKKTRRNEFGAVYGELYRRDEITSYKSLPAYKFEDALAFLTEWYQTITTNTPF